jgi:hypothetical protein
VIAVKAEVDEWIKLLPQRTVFPTNPAPDLVASEVTMTNKLVHMQTICAQMLALRSEMFESVARVSQSIQRLRKAQSKGGRFLNSA